MMNLVDLCEIQYAVVQYENELFKISRLQGNPLQLGSPHDADAFPTHKIMNQKGTNIVVLALPNKQTVSFLEHIPHTTVFVSANEPEQYKNIYTILKIAVDHKMRMEGQSE